MAITLEDTSPLSGLYGRLCYDGIYLYLSTNDTIKVYSLDPMTFITSVNVGTAPSPQTHSGIYHDGTYLYHQNWGPIVAFPSFTVYFQVYSFDGASLSKEAENTQVGFCIPTLGSGITGDGTYVYRVYLNLMAGGSFMEAFRWDGISLVSDGASSFGITPNTLAMMHYQNGYIFVCSSDVGLCKLSYSTPNFTLVHGVADNHCDISGDGTYIYAGRFSENVLDAYDEDLNLITSYTAAPADSAVLSTPSVYCAGGYIFVSFRYHGFKILTFDGSSFTVVEEIDDGSSIYYSVIGS